MYRAERWINGWLWLQSTPNGKWEKASTEQTIVALHERVAALEAAAKMEKAA
jgi:hypothetical protein